ncbi:hypothetical protein EQM13_16870 [Acidilutibacter cellobiosedens]|uniref:Uncharacterized protein n=1 Tax=Acidilutibacter cellobiosedens TaxID=2507161 RepID=A0A410QGK5_9FIRM|nr:hypothetical protein [Acidilutibacter cellobiosedens]QAT63121.1 hypothetical protein EQM13_16870 [Acidilutibacter cellobiosedens]
MNLRILQMYLNKKISFLQIVRSILGHGVLCKSKILFIFALLSLFDIFKETKLVLLPICTFSFLLSLAVEESLHVLTAVHLGRFSAIQGIILRVIYIKTIPLLCYSASVRFTKSDLKEKDLASIAFNGAFFSFLFSLTVVIIIYFLKIRYRKPIAISLLILPILSLFPSKIVGYESDGYIFVKALKHTSNIRYVFDTIKSMFINTNY